MLLILSSSATNLLSDYMYKRRVFTLDPNYFPLERMQEIVDHLHTHDQKYGEHPSFGSGSVPLTHRTN